MPTYEYECTHCQQNFEIFQLMKNEPLTICPADKCQITPWGHGSVKRCLGRGAGIIFKGSGFYTTDYRSEGYKTSSTKDKESNSSKKTDASTEKSKPSSEKSDGK